MSEKRHLLLIPVVLLPFFLLFRPAVCSAGDLPISLGGLQKFSPGDNPEWASPGYDDSRWKEIRVPGSWQSQGVESEGTMGWYRIRFRLEHSPGDERIGILLGRIGDADEVFLNGHKIGAEGVIGDRLVEAPFVERLYEIPPALLVFGRDNVVAVRVMNTYLKGGLYDSGVIVGDYTELLLTKIMRERRTTRVDVILLTLLSVFVLLCFLIHLSGVRDRAYLAFSAFVLLSAVIYGCDNLFFYQSGLKTHAVQKMIYSLMSLVPATLLVFLVFAYRERLNLLVRSLIFSFAVLAVAFLIPWSLKGYIFLYNVWIFLALISVSLAFFFSVRAFKRKVPQSGAFLVGIGVLSAGTLNWILEMLGVVAVSDLYGHNLSDFTLPFTVVCFVYAVDLRFSHSLRSIKTLSEKILIAHEEERKRLARELHDGLGQSLLTTKFNLERVNVEKKDSAIKGAVEELSCVIDELREISSGLRPPFLEEMGLPAALRLYANRISQTTGVKIEVDARLAWRPRPLIEDNVFRIVQEALSNAGKHSGARLIKVRLDGSADRVTTQIEDNGRGFDYAKIRSESRGIGLSTMEERANLMGGELCVDSTREGTIIRVEAPLT